MKSKLALLLAFAGTVLAGIQGLSAAERTDTIKTVSTVAYEIVGAGDGADSTVNLFGPPLERGWAMRARVAAFESNTIAFEPTGWPDGGLQEPDEFYYVEIDTGENARMASDLVSADVESGMIETADDLSAYLSVGDLVTIGRHHTFFSVFDAEIEEEYIKNRARLLAGETAAQADEIIIFDPTTQATESYFLSSTLDAWANARDPDTEIEDFPIWPEQAILIRRRGAGPAILTISGHLHPTPIASFAHPGVNLMTKAPASQAELMSASAFRVDESARPVPPDVRRADTLSAHEVALDNAGASVLSEKQSVNWLSTVGLNADDQLHVIGDTAIVLEQPANESLNLLILKDDE